MVQPSNPVVRRSVRILSAIHELHKQGFQDLAIFSEMVPDGFHWRCTLVHFESVVIRDQQLELREDHTVQAASHSSNEGGYTYFGWKDSKQDTSRALAEKIKERFPALMQLCRRQNYAYAGWFTCMLGEAERGHLPVTWCQPHFFKPPRILSSSDTITIPAPPHERLLKIGSQQFVFRNPPHLREGDDWHNAYCRIIDDWRSSTIGVLPKYPICTNDIHEIGAYWEGAIYYIQTVLGFNRIDTFLEALEVWSQTSERWRIFRLVWDNQNQLVFLKAFLARRMLKEETKYRLCDRETTRWQNWLDQFELTHSGESAFVDSGIPNPYFGGSNPLHLGMALTEVPGEGIFSV